MANADTPFGLRPIDNLYSSSFTGKAVPCVIVAADTTATFKGDLHTVGLLLFLSHNPSI